MERVNWGWTIAIGAVIGTGAYLVKRDIKIALIVAVIATIGLAVWYWSRR